MCQVYDVELDKINKPYLPLASGDFSVATGVRLVVATALGAVAVGLWSGSAPLMATLAGSLVLGIAYSTDLPLLRWKRYPVVAAACIMAVRSFFVHIGFFAHMRGALGLPFTWDPSLVFLIGFMFLFALVIALSKDIPDIKGDKQLGIRTFSVRVGPGQVMRIVQGLLLLAYGGAIAAGLAGPSAWSRWVGGVAPALMAAALVRRSQQVDVDRPKEIYDWYMFLWRLFYLEYCLVPFVLR